QVAKMALALLAVTAVAFVLLRGLARTRAELPEPELRIVERAALNARNHLALIDVGGHRCLIAYGDTFVQRLDEGHELALHRRTRTPAVSEELQ
ncbi:MAG: flagellar biosynthetic protein FliO, partial [Myxococcales bacterium]